MTVRSRFGTFALFGAISAVALVLFAHDAKAQKYDDDGTEQPAAEPVDDGFRPVWQQHQGKAAPRESMKSDSKKQRVAEQQSSDPVRTETTVYDRWTVTCQETLGSGAKKTCSAALRVVDQNQQLVILWEIGRTTDGKIKALMQTPTGVMVQKGVDLKVGDAAVGKLDYAACVPQNCEAAGAMDDPLIKKIEAAPEMVVTIHAKDGRDVNFKFPLKGIDKAVAAVRS
jgi:invasion protein IalB